MQTRIRHRKQCCDRTHEVDNSTHPCCQSGDVFLFRRIHSKSLHPCVWHNQSQEFNFSAVKSTIRLLGKVSLITGYFILSYLPYVLTTLFPLLDYKTQNGKIAHTVLLSLLILNSAVNPFLYILRFQEAIYQMKCLLCFWNEPYTDKLKKRYKEQFATFEIRVP